MKIIAWNINGIRATIKKWFLETIKKEAPDVLCIQEIKAYESQIPAEIRFILKDYDFIRNAAKKPWYAWTATFYKKWRKITHSDMFCKNKLFSDDWRVIETRMIFGNKEFAIFNVYFPNGNPKSNGESMLENKLLFYETFTKHIKELKEKWLYVICGGDFNVAHKEIDLASPQQNKRAIGFLPEERQKIDQMIKIWFTDVFRQYHQEEKGCYTRRSYRTGMKKSNKGWRYDYFFVSPNVLPLIKEVEHLITIDASDHCPLSLTLDIWT